METANRHRRSKPQTDEPKATDGRKQPPKKRERATGGTAKHNAIMPQARPKMESKARTKGRKDKGNGQSTKSTDQHRTDGNHIKPGKNDFSENLYPYRFFGKAPGFRKKSGLKNAIKWRLLIRKILKFSKNLYP